MLQHNPTSNYTQLALTGSKLTIETLEQGLKFVKI